MRRPKGSGTAHGLVSSPSRPMPVRATKRGAERTPLERRLRRPGLRRELRRAGRRRASWPGSRRARAGDRPLRDRRAPDLGLRGARPSGCAQPRPRARRSARRSASSSCTRPGRDRTAGGCRGRSRPSTTASCARCCRPQPATSRSRPRRSTGARATATHVVHTDRGDLRAPLIVDALGWRRVLVERDADPAARRAALARPGGPPAGDRRGPRAVARPAATCARATRWSFPAARRAARRRRLLRPAHHVKEPTVRLAGDLGLPPERLPGQLDPARSCAPPSRTASSSPATPPGTACPPTAEGIRTALYFGLACGRELRAVVEGRQHARAGAGALRRVLGRARAQVPLAAARPARGRPPQRRAADGRRPARRWTRGGWSTGPSGTTAPSRRRSSRWPRPAAASARRPGRRASRRRLSGPRRSRAAVAAARLLGVQPALARADVDRERRLEASTARSSRARPAP